MNKAESKYFNTATKMDNALIGLLEEKEFEYITIKDITQRAGVNRSTFYLHYENMASLLSEVVESMNKEFLSYFPKDHCGDFISSIKDADLKDLYLTTPEYIEPYLKFIRDHKKLYYVSLKNIHTMKQDSAGRDLKKYILNPILDRFNIPVENQKYILAFYLKGITAVTEEWVRNDCREDISVISSTIVSCIRPFSYKD